MLNSAIIETAAQKIITSIFEVIYPEDEKKIAFLWARNIFIATLLFLVTNIIVAQHSRIE